MTQPSSSVPRVGFPSLLGLGIVLLVMAAACLVMWFLGANGAPVGACASYDTSAGECLIQSEVKSLRYTLWGQTAFPLGLGGIVAFFLGVLQSVTRRPR